MLRCRVTKFLEVRFRVIKSGHSDAQGQRIELENRIKGCFDKSRDLWKFLDVQRSSFTQGMKSELEGLKLISEKLEIKIQTLQNEMKACRESGQISSFRDQI